MDNQGQNTLVTNEIDDLILATTGQSVDNQMGQPPAALQSSTMSDGDIWSNYWQTQEQPWRTEPEIPAARQVELDQQRATLVDVEQGRYPFKGFKLSRADIEWLLARYGDEQRSVTWKSALLDLRGADLHKVRLGNIPLQGMYGGLQAREWLLATDIQREAAAVHLEGADLRGASMQGAILCGAHLEGADLRSAHLEGADLRGAFLSGAFLNGAHLEGAILCEAHLEGNENFPKAADLRGVFFDSATNLEGIILGDERYGFAPLADVHWNDVNLSVVHWFQIDRLGDEFETAWKLPVEYQRAIRANRQLAAALRRQGLYDDADHFRYRAFVNERLLHQRQAILPVVLRVFVRERMPLPKVLLRLEERRQGQRMPKHPLRIALIRLLPLLLACLLLAVVKPLLLLALAVLCILSFLLVLPTMRKRRLNPLQYRRAQKVLPPPDLLSQQQRRRQQWLVLLGFLSGLPAPQLYLLLESPLVVLPRLPILGKVWTWWRWKKHPFPVFVCASLLLFVLLLDDVVVCYGRYIFSLLLELMSGYGYKPARILCWYLLVLCGFAVLYGVFGHVPAQAAFVQSLTSFHGYGFFTGYSKLAGSLTGVLAVIEAVIGLLIECCFLVTILRRYLKE